MTLDVTSVTLKRDNRRGTQRGPAPGSSVYFPLVEYGVRKLAKALPKGYDVIDMWDVSYNSIVDSGQVGETKPNRSSF